MSVGLSLDPDALEIQYSSITISGQAIAVCEFHDDNSPSMMVNLVEGNYYCFSCGAYGDANKLVSVTGGEQIWKHQNFSGNRATSDEWLALLKNSSGVEDSFLALRGVENQQVNKYNILSNETQVIFPLLNKRGICTGIKIRNKRAKGRAKYLTFGVMPPYITTGEFPIVADYRDVVVITEGLFGLLRLDKLGYNAITPLSANRIEGLAKLIEVSSHDFYIAFDHDVAGYLAASKLMYLCRHCDNLFAFDRFFEIDDVETERDMPDWDNNIPAEDYNYFTEGFIENEFGKAVALKTKRSFERFRRTRQ